VQWNFGTPSKRHEREPKIQIHAYDEHTFILRQSKATNYEAPFIFLLFGDDRALLLDTGATENAEQFPLRATVDRLISEWLEGHPRDAYRLVVAHSHGHGDHVAADQQFADRPATTIVSREVEAVRSFFGFGDAWPAEIVPFDLGGRVLEIIGSPGHHKSAITIYDPSTAILLTGDTILPGRLYAFDAKEFQATLDRLVDFAATRPVRHVLGCHVEMTKRPGRDYPLGAEYQPDERPLQMTADHLRAARDATAAAAGRPGVYRHDDFILYIEPTQRHLRKLVRRAKLHKLFARLR
jgi:glyoxylase-like metal-dependent hydrolase (beta-lactamase superfamily II)